MLWYNKNEFLCHLHKLTRNTFVVVKHQLLHLYNIAMGILFLYVLTIYSDKLQLAQVILACTILFSQSLYLSQSFIMLFAQVKNVCLISLVSLQLFFLLDAFYRLFRDQFSLHRVIELSHLKIAKTKQYRSAPGSMVTLQEHNSFVN